MNATKDTFSAECDAVSPRTRDFLVPDRGPVLAAASRMHILRRVLGGAGLLILLTAVTADAATIVFGLDAGAGPVDARPQADAARALFLSQAGVVTSIDFEDATGPFPGALPYVTDILTIAGIGQGAENGVRDTPISALTDAFGFNTTAGGSRYLQAMSSATVAELQLTFAHPVTAFGAFFSSLESNYAETVVEFDEGQGVQTWSLPIHDYDASVLFYGLLFEGPVTSLTLRTTSAGGSLQDFYGVDDVVYAQVPVPEPATLTLLGLGLAGTSYRIRRRPRLR